MYVSTMQLAAHIFLVNILNIWYGIVCKSELIKRLDYYFVFSYWLV